MTVRRLVVSALLLALPLALRAETPPSDPKAVAIADQVMKSLGGQKRTGIAFDVAYGCVPAHQRTVVVVPTHGGLGIERLHASVEPVASSTPSVMYTAFSAKAGNSEK